MADEARTGKLSYEQQRILSLVVAGMSDKRIAKELSISVHKVDYHLRLFRRMYNAANRAHLAYLAGRLGLV
jgi:DNA-binding CsgD family transcriptional regulator